ncbi:Uncharacterised protein, partial [Metamycoplasma alkalescens]
MQALDKEFEIYEKELSTNSKLSRRKKEKYQQW